MSNTETRPLGLTIIIGWNTISNIAVILLGLGFFLYVAVFTNGELFGGYGLLVLGIFLIIIIPINILFLILMYGLFKMKPIAYYIYICVTALLFCLSLLSFEIINIIYHAIILTYLLLIFDKFQ